MIANNLLISLSPLLIYFYCYEMHLATHKGRSESNCISLSFRILCKHQFTSSLFSFSIFIRKGKEVCESFYNVYGCNAALLHVRPLFVDFDERRDRSRARCCPIRVQVRSPLLRPPPRFIPPVCQTKRQTWSVRRCLGCVIAGVNSRSLRALILPVPLPNNSSPWRDGAAFCHGSSRKELGECSQ